MYHTRVEQFSLNFRVFTVKLVGVHKFRNFTVISSTILSLQAQHKENHTFAALKQVEIKTEEDLEDFSVEIDILTACTHKNVVGLHEAFYHGGFLWVRSDSEIGYEDF